MLPALGVVMYFASVTIARMGPRTSLESIGNETLLLVGPAIFLALMLIWLFTPNVRLITRNRKVFRFSPCTLLLFVFCFSAALSPFSVEPWISFMYAILTACVLESFVILRMGHSRHLDSAFLFASALLLGLLGYQYVSYGIGPGRFVGNMTPNHFAGTALAAALLAALVERRVKWVLVLFAIPAIVVVNSRGALAALAIFFLVAIYCWSLHKLRLLLALVILVSSLLALTGHFGPSAIDVLSNYFQFDDPGRGLSSGLTGRSDRWQMALRDIETRPLVGYGFRASTRSDELLTSHNAWLDLTRDLGIPLATVVLIAVIWSIARSLPSLNDSLEIRYKKSIIAGGLISLALYASIEVHMFNLGFPLALVFQNYIAYSHTEWHND
jgi:O-antigen ligase